VPIGEGLVNLSTIEDAIQRFHQRHRELYTYSEPDNMCELVGLVIRATARHALPTFSWATDARGEWETLTFRPVRILKDESGAPTEVRVLDGRRAPTGTAVDGPVLIAEENGVVVVPGGWSCVLEPFGAYRLTHAA
jgi:N-methylhydantoinase A